jgi:endonuclease/exonuclease/phosphatase family metal-dependent hydrolase
MEDGGPERSAVGRGASPALRVLTWNLNHAFRAADRRAWEYIESLQPDIALLQEARRPPFEGSIGTEIPRRGTWGTWIVPFGRTALTEIPWISLGEKRPRGYLEASHPGAFCVAQARLPSRRVVTVASVYGMLSLTVRNGRRYAVTTVHRTLSDLTPILDVKRSKAALILAGDLNVTPQIREPDTAAHEAVIQRIKAFGLGDCLGDAHEGRFVRTYAKHELDWQDDWVFASPALRCTMCEPVDTKEAWTLSDHCPVIAEFEFAPPPNRGSP